MPFLLKGWSCHWLCLKTGLRITQNDSECILSFVLSMIDQEAELKQRWRLTLPMKTLELCRRNRSNTLPTSNSESYHEKSPALLHKKKRKNTSHATSRYVHQPSQQTLHWWQKFLWHQQADLELQCCRRPGMRRPMSWRIHLPPQQQTRWVWQRYDVHSCCEWVIIGRCKVNLDEILMQVP